MANRTRITVRYQGSAGTMRQEVTLELTSRDPSRFAQFSEYNVYLAGTLIGTVIGTALTRYDHWLGRRTVTERSWQAQPGRGLVGSRREALQDLLRAWDDQLRDLK